MFLSNSCAVLTSPETTKACKGGWLPNNSAIWFVPLVPTVLNWGGRDGVEGVDIAGVESPPVVLAPNPAGGVGGLVATICFTFAIPPAITAAAPTKPNIPPCARALFAPA